MIKLASFFGQDSLASSEQEHSLGLIGTFAMWLGANIVVTTILTGMYLVPELNFKTAIMLIAVGSGIGVIPLILIGIMGQKTGYTTMVLAKKTFGSKGATMPAAINLISLIAWSWIQALLAGMSLDFAIKSLTGYSNVALFTIICECIVVFIVLFGHRGVEQAEKLAAVLMLGFSGIVFYALIKNYEVSSVLDMTAAGGLSGSVALDIIFATAFSWIPLAADYNRHCKTANTAVVGTWLGYVLATVIAMGLGALVSALSVATGVERTYDPTVLLSNLGFGLPAAIVIFISVITTNVMCVYSATLSYMSINIKSSFWKPALIIGIVSVLGSLIPGILSKFQDFLLIIGSVFVPMFSLMIVDYFLLNRANTYKNLLSDESALKSFNTSAFICYAIGAACAYYWNWVSPLSFGASVPVFLLTGSLYYIYNVAQNKKA